MFNLSLIEGSERQLVEAGAVEALLTVAIVRTHDEDSQAMGIEALQNIMADPASRQECLEHGIVFLLQKLCLSPYAKVQRACAETLHKLALDKEAQPRLVNEGALRSVITVLRQQHEASGVAGGSQGNDTSIDVARDTGSALGSASTDYRLASAPALHGSTAGSP